MKDDGPSKRNKNDGNPGVSDKEFNARFTQSFNASDTKPKAPKRTAKMVGGVGAEDYNFPDGAGVRFTDGCEKW